MPALGSTYIHSSPLHGIKKHVVCVCICTWSSLTVAKAGTAGAVDDDDDENEFHPQLVNGISSDSDEGERDENDDYSEA